MAKGKHAKGKKKNPKGKKPLIIIAAVLAVIIVAALATGYAAGHSSKTHPGMTLGGVSIGDMSAGQAEKALDAAGWAQREWHGVEVTLPGGFVFTVSPKDAGTQLTSAQAAEAALKYGHTGNILRDLAAYFKCITGGASDADILMAASPDGVKSAVEKALAEYREQMGDGYEVDTENAVLKMIKGAESIEIDEDKLCQSVLNAFRDGERSVKYSVSAVSAKEPDFTKLHEELYAEALDAKYDPETQRATESRIGIDFDAAEAKALWEKAETGGTVSIPLKVTMPKYTTEQLDKMLFADKLGTMTTSYASSNSNRANNVELSAKKINGYILNPGETFSYNTVVGKRTRAAGFKEAGAYAGGQVVQEVGGGICQTSSTLYCAALYANLQIVARDEHGFSVAYVPWGMDATVSWGGPEFKFKNNREFPVKIVTRCENRKLTIEIWGTDTDGSYVKMDYSAWTVYDTTYPDVAIGTKAVTYRCVYDKDGSLISRTKEANSYYHYHPEDIKWPTPEPTPTPAPEPEITPEPTPEENTRQQIP